LLSQALFLYFSLLNGERLFSGLSCSLFLGFSFLFLFLPLLSRLFLIGTERFHVGLILLLPKCLVEAAFLSVDEVHKDHWSLPVVSLLVVVGKFIQPTAREYVC